MFHPLLGSTHKLTDIDIDNKIADLSKKYGIAARMGQSDLCHQISMALDLYKSDQLDRQYALTQKMIKSQNRDLDGLVGFD